MIEVEIKTQIEYITTSPNRYNKTIGRHFQENILVHVVGINLIRKTSLQLNIRRIIMESIERDILQEHMNVILP